MIEIDARAFNAFLLWRDGLGAPIMSYPPVFPKTAKEFTGNYTADSVFFDLIRDSSKGVDNYKAPTTGVTVDNENVLIYPIKDGRKLELKFMPAVVFSPVGAIRHCLRVGLRLPIAQEVFDYCAAGAQLTSNGNYATSRCGSESGMLSTTLPIGVYYGVTAFEGRNGEGFLHSGRYQGAYDRGYYFASCVGTREQAAAANAEPTHPNPGGASDPSAKQVNPMAFNAYLLWRDGGGQPILTYPGNPGNNAKTAPQDYEKAGGVFFESSDSSYDPFSVPSDYGLATEGAVVEGDTLIYPVRNGQQLKIKFSIPQKVETKIARDWCSKKGLRMPTLREMFDFCNAGTPRGVNWEYPKSRCRDKTSYTSYITTTFNKLSENSFGAAGYGTGDFTLHSYSEHNATRTMLRCVGPAN